MTFTRMMTPALAYHARHAHTEEQRAAAVALLAEQSRGQISRTAACRAMTAAAAKRQAEKDQTND